MWQEFVHSFFVISTPCIFFGENNREHSTFQHEAVLQYRFYRFFAVLWVHAKLLIIVRLCSNLRCWIVRHLSFLEKKNRINLSSLLDFLHLFKYCVQFFGQKTSKKMCALLKNQNLFPTYFLNGK